MREASQNPATHPAHILFWDLLSNKGIVCPNGGKVLRMYVDFHQTSREQAVIGSRGTENKS